MKPNIFFICIFLIVVVNATENHVTELNNEHILSYYRYYDDFQGRIFYSNHLYRLVGRYDDFPGEPYWHNVVYRGYVSTNYPGTFPDYGIIDSVLCRIKLDNIYTTNYSDTMIIRDAQDYYVGGMYVSDENMWNSIDDGERYYSLIFNPYTEPGWTSKYFYPGDSLFNAVEDSIENDSYFELGFHTNVEGSDNRRLRIDDFELKIYWHEDPETEVTVENRYNTGNLGGYLSVSGVGSSIASGTTLDLTVDATYTTETQSQRFASPAVQHHHWNSDESEYRLSADIEVQRETDFIAKFKDYDEIMLSSSISADVYIKDPWYVNPSTGEQDNPYQTVEDYEVFLNHNYSFNDSIPSYYIKAPAYTGSSGSYNVFHQWSTGGSTTFQSSTSPETKTCFKDANTVTAEYYTGISVTDGTLGHDAGGYYISFTEDRIYATTSGIYAITGWQSSDNNKAQIVSGDGAKCYVTFSGSNVTLSPVTEQVNNQTDYSLSVNSNETLSIPADANIECASGFGIELNSNASFKCLGTTQQPITLSGISGASWDGISDAFGGDTIILENTTVEDASNVISLWGYENSVSLNSCTFEGRVRISNPIEETEISNVEFNNIASGYALEIVDADAEVNIDGVSLQNVSCGIHIHGDDDASDVINISNFEMVGGDSGIVIEDIAGDYDGFIINMENILICDLNSKAIILNMAYIQDGYSKTYIDKATIANCESRAVMLYNYDVDATDKEVVVENSIFWEDYIYPDTDVDMYPPGELHLFFGKLLS